MRGVARRAATLAAAASHCPRLLAAPLHVRLASTAAASPTKLSTGLTGLDVVPNARAVLIKLYEKTLNDVQVCSYPERAAGRRRRGAATRGYTRLRLTEA